MKKLILLFFAIAIIFNGYSQIDVTRRKITATWRFTSDSIYPIHTKLLIKGILIPDSFRIGNYAFPKYDGTANQVLQTNGSGKLSWSTITVPSLDTVFLLASKHYSDNKYQVKGQATALLTCSDSAVIKNKLIVNDLRVLTGDLNDHSAVIYKNQTLGAFTSTGAVLRISDLTASTGDILNLWKQGVKRYWFRADTGLVIKQAAGQNITMPSIKILKSDNTLLGRIAFDGSNICFGTSGNKITSGTNNIIIAQKSPYGDDLSTGSDNVVIGNSQGWGCIPNSFTTGNTFVGSNLNYWNNSLGNLNTGVGYGILNGAPGGGSITNTTVMGAYAGFDIRAGDANLFLGYRAGYCSNNSSGSYNILIGDSTCTPTPTQSMYMNLGNTIYSYLAAKYVGIGTESPTTFLDINGDKYRIRVSRTINNANEPGNVGDICWDNNYIYVCVMPNQWKRVAISNW